MKIKQRLYFLVGAGVVSACIMAGNSFISDMKLVDVFADYQEMYEVTQYIGELEMLGGEMARDSMNAIIGSYELTAEAPARVRGNTQEIQQKLQLLETRVGTLDTMLHTPEERRAAAEVASSYKALSSLTALLIQRIQTENYAEAVALSAALDKAYGDFRDKVTLLRQASDDDYQTLLNAFYSALASMKITAVTVFAGSLLAQAAIAYLIISQLSQRINAIVSAIRKLQAGEREFVIANADAKDELGDIARSLEAFRETVKKADNLAAQQKLQQTEREKRQRRIEERITGFETKAQQAVSMVSSAATELFHAAEQMTKLVSNANSRAEHITASAAKTSENVQSVASAAEEMSASVREISMQIVKSTGVVQDAVSKNEAANVAAKSLEEATKAISSILDMIESIAGQINLLALNATIESARAGEAGKGFAVVAQEVKTLANQTTSATGEITGQVKTMQTVAQHVLTSLHEINQVIRSVNEYTSAISSAVEQQLAVTNEIAANMSTAACGVLAINDNIRDVSGSAQQAQEASRHVLNAAEMLSQQSEMLNAEINSFLKDIQAA